MLTCRGGERDQILLELEFQMAVTHMSVLETELRSLEEQYALLTTKTPLQPPLYFLRDK